MSFSTLLLLLQTRAAKRQSSSLSDSGSGVPNIEDKNIIELFQIRDEVAEKKRKIMAEYFKQEALEEEITKFIKKRVGYK